MKFSQKDYLKNLKTLLTKDKLNMFQRYLNHQYLFIHLFDMWIPRTSRIKKTRTNDLALEINKVSLEDETNNKVLEHEEHLMVTQSGDPTNKRKPAFK